MSYQVLARKWRPSRFSEMAGQEHVLKALVNALDSGRLHHAYLFTGTRGVGKTSIARLFARALNCETGVTSDPCGVCSACREIAEGRFVDLIEVDAASRTKVEDTRELLENVQYAPSHGRYKVYLIDEVHMLSNSSFNALLKTLEEPPPHIKFLLATTDPQKLPVTVLSRCLQFNLKNLSAQRIVEHLHHVLNAEEISFDEPALWLLARSADGSMRDALSLTDQAIAYGSGEVNEADVRAMLGTIDQRLVYGLLLSVARHETARVIETVHELSQYTPDYMAVLADLISLLHRIALAQMLPQAIDNSLGDQQQVLELAQLMCAEEVQLFYQIALMGRKDLPYAPDLREGLEMVLLRMLAFRPANAEPCLETATSEPERLNAAPEPAPAVLPAVPTAPQEPESAPMQASVRALERTTPDIDPVAPPQQSLECPAVDGIDLPAPTEADEGGKKPESAVEVAESLPQSLQQLRPEHWVLLSPALTLSGMTANICRNLSLEQIEQGQLCFHYRPEQAELLNDTQRQRISDALQSWFGTAVKTEFVCAPPTRETPYEYQLRREQERRQEAIALLRTDPLVQQLMDRFDAELDEASVVALQPES